MFDLPHPSAIKRWLKQIGQDRTWLANQCGVSKSTVDGWLGEGTQRPIPGPSRRLIETLMNQKMSINPKLNLNEYARIQQLATQRNISVTEWIEDCIKKALLLFIFGLVLFLLI